MCVCSLESLAVYTVYAQQCRPQSCALIFDHILLVHCGAGLSVGLTWEQELMRLDDRPIRSASHTDG